MEAIMLKIKPYKGRYCSRRRANEMRDFLESLPSPDRTALKREADEFRAIVTERRARRASVLGAKSENKEVQV